MMNQDEIALWDSYDAGDDTVTNALIDFYARYMTHLAQEYSRKTDVDVDDLLNVARFAVWRLLPHYKRELGLFWTFARRRVNGAMVDFIRQQGQLSRTAYTHSREANKLRNRAAQAAGRAVSDNELIADGVLPSKLPVDRVMLPLTRKDGKLDNLMLLCEARVSVSAEALAWADAIAEVGTGLNSTTRRALLMYARDGYTMKEIAAELNLSESRISQLFSQSAKQLAEKYDHAGERRSTKKYKVETLTGTANEAGT